MANLLTGDTIGALYDGTAHNANLNQIENSFSDLGPAIISGLTVTIGTGLSVAVAAGTASIGGRVTAAASFSIAGLTPSTTNHLYMLQSGAGAANTAGTAPANSVKLGTCITGVGTVTSVAATWASGRQQQTRTENLVLGSGAGNPRALNLASWHATNNEGNECKGALPSTALPADVAYVDAANQFTSVQKISTTNATILTLAANGTGGLAFTQAAATKRAIINLCGAYQFGTDSASNNTGDFWLQSLASGNLVIQSTPTDLITIGSNNSFGGAVLGAGGGKVAFFGGTPVLQPANTDDLRQALINLNLYPTGGATPLNLNGGALAAGAATLAGDLTLSAHNLVTDTTTGTRIGTASTQKLGFFGATPAAQIGGSTDVLAAMVTLGFRAASSNPPLNLGTGAVTCGTLTCGQVGGNAAMPNFQSATITPTADADYTLLSSEYSALIMSLTAGSWTAGHKVIFPATAGGLVIFKNGSGFAAAAACTGGDAGISVANNMIAILRNNGAAMKRVTADTAA